MTTRPPGRKRHSAEIRRLAHELRTPLAAIQSMADALHGGHLGKVGNERHLAYLASIRDTARHALAVMAGMLGTGDPAPTHPADAPAATDLATLAAEVVTSLASIADQRGAKLAFLQPPRGLLVQAPATDIRQMLINLVSNGLSHGGRGAEIAITIAPVKGGFGAIEVSDDGPGIAQAVLDRVTSGAPIDATASPAFRDRVRLGLTLTKSLAEANGGRLELKSGAKGTRARIVLPLAEA
ncbi:MAG: HAMP domain-containing histidine kinase [Proteobacteria bacterium]|nr:HAMP domain-containing histidine kinase [Pseudomonadota bacterium]